MGLVALLALAACGGSKTEANEPSGGGDDDDDGAGGDYIVSEEKMDEITSYFQRKQSGRAITDCWVKAMEAKEVPDQSKGRLTLNMTIGTSGQVTKVTTAQLQPSSAKTFESCVVDKVKTWTIVPLEQPFETSWTFQAGEL